MVEVRNNGVPLIEQAPKAGITQSIMQMAQALSDSEKSPEEEDAAAKKQQKPWMSFFGGKK